MAGRAEVMPLQWRRNRMLDKCGENAVAAKQKQQMVRKRRMGMTMEIKMEIKIG
jgi:hypothetical protein